MVETLVLGLQPVFCLRCPERGWGRVAPSPSEAVSAALMPLNSILDLRALRVGEESRKRDHITRASDFLGCRERRLGCFHLSLSWARGVRGSVL